MWQNLNPFILIDISLIFSLITNECFNLFKITVLFKMTVIYVILNFIHIRLKKTVSFNKKVVIFNLDFFFGSLKNNLYRVFNVGVNKKRFAKFRKT